MRQQQHLGDDGLPFKLSSSSMFLLEELPGILHTTMRGSDLSFSSADVLDKGLESLPKSINLLVDKHDGRVAVAADEGVR
jgi:hypothetical protein